MSHTKRSIGTIPPPFPLTENAAKTELQSAREPASPTAFGIPDRRTAPYTQRVLVPKPTHDDIARRAYDIYLATGRKSGQCRQNWHQAEQALRNPGSGDHLAARHSWDAADPEMADAE